MQPDITPQVERKPLSKTATIALRYLNEDAQRGLEEILVAAAAEQGINAADGWDFDPQTQSWARQVKE